MTKTEREKILELQKVWKEYSEKSDRYISQLESTLKILHQMGCVSDAVLITVAQKQGIRQADILKFLTLNQEEVKNISEYFETEDYIIKKGTMVRHHD